MTPLCHITVTFGVVFFNTFNDIVINVSIDGHLSYVTDLNHPDSNALQLHWDLGSKRRSTYGSPSAESAVGSNPQVGCKSEPHNARCSA